MANKKLSASNNRHSFLADLNSRKWLRSGSGKNGKVYDIKRAYHESVIEAQKYCGRVLTKDERKHVYDVVQKEGRVVTFLFHKYLRQ